MRTYFITGFPGFIAAFLLPRLLSQGERAYLLVQERFRTAADQKLAQLGLASQARLVVGDITVPDLGVDKRELAELVQEVDTVFHLAAIYDLAVPKKAAYQVNVRGTRHILDFCEKLANLERLFYVSTCYVAGRRQGVIRESELDQGQGFYNFYEQTKFLAELAVVARRHFIPTTIYRPAVVVGDSRSGEFVKIDGPYFLMKALLDHQRWGTLGLWRWVPRIGGYQSALNVVPVDYLIDSMVMLTNSPASLGKTYHLADPAPNSIGQVMDRLFELLGLGRPKWDLPANMLTPLRWLPWLGNLTGLPAATLPYLNHGAQFDTSNTQQDTPGLSCPHLVDYLDVLLECLRTKMNAKMV